MVFNTHELGNKIDWSPWSILKQMEIIFIPLVQASLEENKKKKNIIFDFDNSCCPQSKVSPLLFQKFEFREVDSLFCAI